MKNIVERYFLYDSENEDDKMVFEFETRMATIYNSLADDISKRVFVDRLMYSLTKDYRYIYDLILTTNEGFELDMIFRQHNEGRRYIYGAGVRGRRIPKIFDKISFTAYIDREKQGLCNGLPIIRLPEVAFQKEDYVLVSNEFNTDEIKKQLTESGALAEKIIVLSDINDSLEQRQYCEEFIKIKSGAMVDAEADDGRDILKYLRRTDDNCVFFAFETNSECYEKCKRNLSCVSNGKIYKMGLADKLESDKSLTTIDSLNQKIGFIKLDVEGCEKKALKGAANTIKNNKPTLAISLYHKKEDIWEIPLLLLELNKSYKFYLRHYSVGITETVLYAVDTEIYN